MDEREFERIVSEAWAAMPEHFRKKVENVAVLIEDEPSEELRREEGLHPEETLLGFYHGIPNTERGSLYGVGGTLPDTITLFRLPILEEARELQAEGESFSEAVHRAVQETIWHEVGHYFGFGEKPLRDREHTRTNAFETQSVNRNKRKTA